MIINNENEIRNTENLVQAQNESNIAYKDSNNHSIINESRSNNSILNTSEKRHLYYFNDLKYEGTFLNGSLPEDVECNSKSIHSSGVKNLAI